MDNCKSIKICAYVSLAISVVLAVLWICNVGGLTVVTLETFVGVIVALLAIIVTIAIIWQIYNAIDMKNKIEELKQLEGKMKDQEKSLEKFKLETTRDLCGVAMVIKRDSNDIPIAFSFSMDAIKAEIQLEKPNQYDIILDFMQSINELINKNVKIETSILNDINNKDEIIRSHSNYRQIKRRYEPIYNEFMSKVEKLEE